jgi:hypothetical protein
VASGTELSIEVHQQKFLAEGDTAMHAILSVTARGGPEASAGAAEVLLIDCSSSMRHPRTKIEEAKRAAAAAIDALPDGVRFAVVRGTETASTVYPPGGRLVAASAETRRAARKEIARLTAFGGTAMGRWLGHAKWLFDGHAATVRHAILLTDGRNQSESHESLVKALDSCEGHFVCDALGVGDGWLPDELAEIVKVLRGTADSVVEPRELDFEGLVGAALTKVLPEVRLRIGTMEYSSLAFVKQVYPGEYDLTDRCRPAGDREVVLALGSFSGAESRDYHIRVDLDGTLEPSFDEDRQLAWAELAEVAGARTNGPVAVLGRWTHGATVVHPLVERYTARARLAEAITAGGDALAAGRTADAERAWEAAVRLATAQGDEEVLDRLRGVVEISGTGSVRLRPGVGRSAVLHLLISAVSRIGSSAKPEPEAAGPPVTCPHCGMLSPAGARLCERCRTPLGEATT